MRNPFKEPKAKFCYKCGEELITYQKSGYGEFANEDWLMLSCPSQAYTHFSTILKAWTKLPDYDIYTGRRLDGNSHSLRR